MGFVGTLLLGGTGGLGGAAGGMLLFPDPLLLGGGTGGLVGAAGGMLLLPEPLLLEGGTGGFPPIPLFDRLLRLIHHTNRPIALAITAAASMPKITVGHIEVLATVVAGAGATTRTLCFGKAGAVGATTAPHGFTGAHGAHAPVEIGGTYPHWLAINGG